MKNRINVIIVDDHFIIREGTKNILSQDPSIRVIAEAADGQSALKIIAEHQEIVDIVILDINLPDMDGYEVLFQMKEKNLKGKVLMLSAYDREEYFLRAQKLGADGFVMKTSSTTHLLEGIRTVMQGKQFFQSPASIEVSEEKNDDSEDAMEKIRQLTKREFEILSLVSKGLSNKEMASRLFISEKTVKNHLSSIFRKLDIEDRVQAVVFSYKNHLNADL